MDMIRKNDENLQIILSSKCIKNFLFKSKNCKCNTKFLIVKFLCAFEIHIFTTFDFHSISHVTIFLFCGN